MAYNQNPFTAGLHGPFMTPDYQPIENPAHQNREGIPGRAVHAKNHVDKRGESCLIYI